jgi:hypothetical protein
MVCHIALPNGHPIGIEVVSAGMRPGPPRSPYAIHHELIGAAWRIDGGEVYRR